jgi:hypothetical protein
MELCCDMVPRRPQRSEGDTGTSSLQCRLHRSNLRWNAPVEDDWVPLVCKGNQSIQKDRQA